MPKHWTHSFAEAVTDVRQKLIEEGFWGRVVTPRAQTLSFGTLGDQSPAEKLGWFQRAERPEKSQGNEHERDATIKEPKAPERGIDL